MADPATISLISVGSVVITEGVKFLYGQAADLLRRLRERQNVEQGNVPQSEVIPVEVILPPHLKGTSFSADVSMKDLEKVRPDLEALLNDLAGQAAGYKEIDSSNETMMKRINKLRSVVEALVRHELTFIGEERSTESLSLVAKATVKDIEGELTLIRAADVKSGKVIGELHLTKVHPNAKVVGIDVGNVGG